MKLSNTAAAQGASEEGGDPGVCGPTPKDDVARTSKTREDPLRDVSPPPTEAAPLQQEKDVEKTDVHLPLELVENKPPPPQEVAVNNPPPPLQEVAVDDSPPR